MASIHLLAMAYQRALQIEPDRYDTLYNLANLIKDDQPEEVTICINVA